jgi:hypothetical protein
MNGITMEVFNGTPGGAAGDDLDGKEPAAVKANKGMILRKSVEYIRFVPRKLLLVASCHLRLFCKKVSATSGCCSSQPQQ